MAVPDLQKSASAGENLGEGESRKGWSPARRAVFRFVCSYLVLFNLPFPLNVLPQGFPPYDNLLTALTLWVGRHTLHRTVVMPAGSGDTTGGWVQIVLFLVITGLTTAVWTALDRKRPHYDRLYDWLRVYVRFTLAAAMISYGAVKIIPAQFPVPSLDRLMEPIGDSSPMGLLWTLMGASPAYQFFGGLLEMAGGLLLTTRHTTLLGALLCVGVLSNVVALNFCYDVPVKIYSAHLLLMAVFLAAPYAGRLWDLFIRGRAVGPALLHRLFQDRRLNRAALVLRTVCVVGFVGMQLWSGYQLRAANIAVPNSPLYGIWVVDEWRVDGALHPPLLTDTAQWHRVVLDNPQWLAVQTVTGSWQRFLLTRDAATQTMKLKSRSDPAWSSTLAYTQPEPGRLTLAGMLDGHQVRARLHHEDGNHSLLLRRGFHWINEYSFNR